MAAVLDESQVRDCVVTLKLQRWDSVVDVLKVVSSMPPVVTLRLADFCVKFATFELLLCTSASRFQITEPSSPLRTESCLIDIPAQLQHPEDYDMYSESESSTLEWPAGGHPLEIILRLFQGNLPRCSIQALSSVVRILGYLGASDAVLAGKFRPGSVNSK